SNLPALSSRSLSAIALSAVAADAAAGAGTELVTTSLGADAVGAGAAGTAAAGTRAGAGSMSFKVSGGGSAVSGTGIAASICRSGRHRPAIAGAQRPAPGP